MNLVPISRISYAALLLMSSCASEYSFNDKHTQQLMTDQVLPGQNESDANAVIIEQIRQDENKVVMRWRNKSRKSGDSFQVAKRLPITQDFQRTDELSFSDPVLEFGEKHEYVVRLISDSDEILSESLPFSIVPIAPHQVSLLSRTESKAKIAVQKSRGALGFKLIQILENGSSSELTYENSSETSDAWMVHISLAADREIRLKSKVENIGNSRESANELTIRQYITPTTWKTPRPSEYARLDSNNGRDWYYVPGAQPPTGYMAAANEISSFPVYYSSGCNYADYSATKILYATMISRCGANSFDPNNCSVFTVPAPPKGACQVYIGYPPIYPSGPTGSYQPSW